MEDIEQLVGGMEEKTSSPRRKKSVIALIPESAPISSANGFSKRQWTLFIFFATIDTLAAMVISLQAPFYPMEAEAKGSTAAEYGFVFGIFEFVVFLMSPIYGKYMNKIGPKRVFSASILLNSVAIICFGLLHWMNDHIWFITLSFICRIVEGLGAAGFFTSTFVMISCEFPQSVASIFAALETFIGIGFIIGPTVGGALYGLGGFPLPFFVVGSCLIVTGLSAMLIMPPIQRATDADGMEQQGYGVWAVLKIPSVALAAISMMTTAMSMGFISAVLEPHIRRFELTPFQTGLVFVVNGGVYAIFAPLWGYICDNITRPAYITVLGNLLLCISFVFIGPAPFIPFDTILWVTIIGLIFHGLGLGGCFVSTFIVGLKESLNNGLPNNLATYAVSAGLWQSMVSLGACIGPSAAGLLFDTVGFREGSLLVFIVPIVAGMAIVIHSCFTPRITLGNKSSEKESLPLLSPMAIPIVRTKGDVDETCAVLGQPKSYGST